MPKTNQQKPISPTVPKIPERKDLVNPFPDAYLNLAAKGHLLTELSKTGQGKRTKEAWLRTKGPTTADVDAIMLDELYREIYAKHLVRLPIDDVDEPPLDMVNGARLKELSHKQQMDLILKTNAYIKKEKHQCTVAAQEKNVFFQEVDQLNRRTRKNASALLILDQELSDAGDEFRNRIMINKEKLKHLMSEQYTESCIQKTEEMDRLPGKFESNWRQEQVAYEGLMQLVQEEINKRQILDSLNRELRLDQASNMLMEKEEFVATQETVIDAFEHHVELLRKATEKKLKEYIRKADDNKSFCITHMLEVQSKNLNNLRNYFQDIVASNADIINELKKQVDSRRAALERVERATYSALEELGRYQEPMQKTETEIAHCETVLSTSRAVRERLTKLHIQKRHLAEEVKRLRWIKEIEQTKIEKCKEELKELQQSYYATKFSIMQKAALSAQVHNKASSLMSDEVNMYEITYAILKDLSGFSPSAVAQCKNTVEAVLSRDMVKISTLLAEAAALKTKYQHLWDVASHAFQQQTKMTLEAVGFKIPDLAALFPKNMRQTQIFKTFPHVQRIPDISAEQEQNESAALRLKKINMHDETEVPFKAFRRLKESTESVI